MQKSKYIMEKLVFTLLLSIACIQSFAQRVEYEDGTSYNFQWSPIGGRIVSEKEFTRYFDMYSETLDPLEGIYDLEVGYIFLKRGYARPQINKGTHKLVICKDGEYIFGKIIFPTGSTGNQEPFLIFKRIGNTNAYTLYERSNSDKGFLPKHSERFVLNNGTFSLEFELSQDEVLNLNSNVREAMNNSQYVNRFYSAIKTYPQTKSENNITQGWTGTGFALLNGYIATNWHVVKGASNITVTGVNGNFNADYKATVIAKDETNDLAIIKIDDNSFKGFATIPYSIKTSTCEVGEDIYVLGYPLTATMGEEIKLTTGVISSKTGFQGDVSLYQISAPIQPGNSGGPLFDNNGNVIGIVNAKHSDAENVGYAIKASYLRNLIESFTNDRILPSINTTSGLRLPDKVKKEKNFVFYIKCKP